MDGWSLKVGATVDVKSIQKQLNMTTAKVTITPVLNNKGEFTGVTKTVTQLNDALGKTYTITEKVNAENITLSSTVTKIGKSFSTSAKNIDSASKSATTFSQKIVDSTKKVAQFAISTTLIGLVTGAFYKAVSAVKDYDDAQTEFTKVSNLSGKELDSYSDKLAQLGKSVYASKTDMIEAASVFRQASYTDEQSAQLAQMAKLFQNISDKEVSMSDASSFLVATMKSFNIQASDSISVLDKVNAVSNNYASTTNDISSALNKNASVFAAYGNTISESIGLITAGVEKMPNQSGKISNGLRSIAVEVANLQTQGKDLTISVQGVNKEIDLFDKQGNALPTFEVLKEISSNWKDMTIEEKNAIATEIAHKTQANTFIAILSNFNTAIKANETAMNSQGSAWTENEKRAQSITAALKALGAEFVNIVTKGNDLKTIGFVFITLATDILKVVESVGGLRTIFVALAGVLLTINIEKIASGITSMSKIVPNLISYMSRLVDTFIATRNSALVATGALDGAAGAMTTLQAAMGALAVVFTVVSVALSAYSQHEQAVAQAREESNQSIQDSITSLDTLSDKIKNEVITRDQLKDAISGSSDSTISAMNSEIDTMDDVNTARQKVIDKIDEQKKAQANLYVSENLTEYESALKKISSDVTSTSQLSGYFEQLSQSLKFVIDDTSGLDSAIKKLDTAKGYDDEVSAITKVHDQLVALRNEYEKGSYQYNTYNKAIKESENSLSELQNTSESEKSTVSTMNDMLASAGEKYDQSINSVVKLKEAKKEQAQAQDDSTSATSKEAEASDYLTNVQLEQKDSVTDLETAIEAYNQALESGDETSSDYKTALSNLKEVQSNLSQQYSDSISSISGMGSAFNTLNSAVSEYNSAQGITQSTLGSLLSLGSEYQGLLTEENGKMVVNQQAAQNLVSAKIADAKATAVQNTITMLATGQFSSYASAASNAASASSSSASSSNAAANGFANVAKNAATAAGSVASYMSALTGSSEYQKASKDAQTQAKAFLNTQLTMIDSISKQTNTIVKNTGSTKSNTSAKKSGTGATKANTDATKANTDALEEQKKALQSQIDAVQDEIDKYKKAIDYIDNRYQKAIDKLKDKEDSLVDAISDQKDALQEKYDAQVSAIEKTSDAISKEKDAYDDNIDAQTKALSTAEDAQKEYYENQISALKDTQDARKQYWDDLIQSIEDANTATENQITLQEKLDALAQAKASKVLVMDSNGQWTYQSDETKVTEAQQALDEYQRELLYNKQISDLETKRDAEDSIYQQEIDNLTNLNDNMQTAYENQIASLESQKDAQNAIYQQQIDNLSAQKDSLEEIYNAQVAALDAQTKQIQAEYNAQIAQIQSYKDAFDAMVSAYEDNQGKLLAEQLTGMNMENDTWMTRLDNLQNFVNNYTAKMSQLQALQDQLNALAGQAEAAAARINNATSSAGGGGSSTSSTPTTTTTTSTTTKNILPTFQQTMASGTKTKNTSQWAKVVANQSKTIIPKLFASGTSSLDKDGMIITGENPHKEIVVGSSLNNGVAVNATKGTGVINANGTRTLAGMANMMGALMTGKTSAVSTNSSTNSSSISIGNITLPSVSNASQFMTELASMSKGLKSGMVQNRYSNAY